MTFELVGGAGWNVLTADQEIHAVLGAFQGIISGNRKLLTYEGQNHIVYLGTNFSKTYGQVIIPDFSVGDWVGSGDGDKSIMISFRISLTLFSLILKVVKVNATDYKFEIVTTDFVGAEDQTDFSDKTDFKWDTIYDAIRIISDGTTVTLEVDTGSGFVEQASIATSLQIDRCELRTTDHSDAGNSIGYGRVSICHYDSLSERKGVPTITWRTPTAEGSVHSEYIVDSGPQHGRVDDWEVPNAMGVDIDAVSLTDEATGKQSYDIGTGGTTTGYTVVGTVGVILYTYQSVSVAAKGGTFYALLVDTTPTEDELGASPFSDSDKRVRGLTNTAPDGGPWTTGDFTGLEVMVKATNGTDGALNAEVNAIGLEIYDFPADPGISEVTGAAVLSGSGALTATATVETPGAAVLSGVGALSVVSTVDAKADATLSGSGALVAAGTAGPLGAAVLSGSGALTATSAVIGISGAAVLAGAGDLAAAASVDVFALAVPSGTGALAAIGRTDVLGLAALSGTGTLTAEGTVSVGATLTGSGDLSAVASVGVLAEAALSGTGFLTAVASVSVGGASVLSGSGSLSAVALAATTGASVLSGSGALSAVGAPSVVGQATLSGAGSLSGVAAVDTLGAALLTGSGDLSASSSGATTGAAAMSGAGDLSATGEVGGDVTGAAILAGTGALTAIGTATQIARPDGDQSIGAWTDDGDGTIDIWQAIDEIVAADSDFIQSEIAPSSSPYVTTLSSVSPPASGTRTARYRYAKDAAGGETIDLTVELLEGAVVKHTWTHLDISDTVVQANQIVTASINDYANLRIRFTAN